MIPCPSCQKPTREGLACEACGADLRLPTLLDRLGRMCFNRGLELAAKDELASAESQFCAAAALMPLRFETYRALGKLRARGGRLLEAAIDLQTALKLAPEDEESKRAFAEVQRLAKRERMFLLATPLLLAVLTAATIAMYWLLR